VLKNKTDIKNKWKKICDKDIKIPKYPQYVYNNFSYVILEKNINK
jgi:hypothetical protein